MKITLVTGATGFVGGHLTRALLARGERLRILTNSISPQPLSHPNAQVVVGDINDEALLKDLVQDCAKVFHLAACVPAPGLSGADYRRVNIQGVQTIVNACKHVSLDRFVHVSTVGVYGTIKRPPATEASPVDASSAYRASKIAGESVVRAAVEGERLPAVIVRLPDMAGPGAISWLGLARAIRRGGFRVVGDGSNRNQLADVSDAVNGLLLCGDAPKIEGETFLLAGRDAPSVNEILDVIRRELGAPPIKRHVPAIPYKAYVSTSETIYKLFGRELPWTGRYGLFLNRKEFSIEKARDVLGYEPRIGFEAALIRTLDQYRLGGLL